MPFFKNYFQILKINNHGTQFKFQRTNRQAQFLFWLLCKALHKSHNHPSGNLKPSRADEELTKKIATGGMYLDIKVIDHIIVTSEGYYSFANEGLL